MLSRLGLFCYRKHRWLLTCWLGVIVVGALTVGPVFGQLGASSQIPGTESSQASQAMQQGTNHGLEFTALVDGIDASNAATTTALIKASVDTRRIPGIQSVAAPVPATNGRAVAITVTLAKSPSQHQSFVEANNRMRQLASEVQGAKVEIGGADLIGDQTNEAVQSDLQRAEVFSLPITLVVLVFVFGGIFAAGLPVLAAIGALLGAFVLLFGFSLFVNLDSNAITVVTLLGLALSIDYGLLLVSRYRDELTRTADRSTAISRTWRTAGRTILFSGLTVVAALSGLLVFDVARLRTIAAAGVSTTAIALLASLTLTAALLRLVGRRVTAHKRTAIHARDPERGLFARLARFIQRVPALAFIGSLVVLIAIATPLLGVNIKVLELDGLPRSMESLQVAEQLDSQFGVTTQAAVRVVARTDPATLNQYTAQWRDNPAVLRVEPAAAANDTVSSAVIAVRGDSQGPQARQLVDLLRAHRPIGYQSWVGGDAASLIDLDGRLLSGLPLALGMIVLAMAVLLFIMTGSIVMPLKAVILNSVSLAATFGVLTAVFQNGWLAVPLGMLVGGGLSPYMIMIVFAFAFGLSMDYELFLLARIKEHVDAGKDSATAVRYGLQCSGRVITSAALLMLIVFAFFATAKVGDLQQVGLGLFVAVLIDATLVRCVLVPATMTLLGKAAWWAPNPLRRLYNRYGLREHGDGTAVKSING